MSEKKYYWFKFKKDFFEQLTIKYLRKLENGDTLVLTYLKLITIGLDSDCIIQLKGIYSSIEEELALMLDENLNSVKTLLESLKKSQAIEYDKNENVIFLKEMQNLVGKEGASAQRTRKYRKNKQQENIASHCDDDVTMCDTEKEIEIEIDEEKEKKREDTENNNKQIRENNSMLDCELVVAPFDYNNENFIKIKNLLAQTLDNAVVFIVEEAYTYLNDLPYEAIEKAVNIAAQKGKNWDYAKGILDNWLNRGLNTMNKIVADELKFRANTIWHDENIAKKI